MNERFLTLAALLLAACGSAPPAPPPLAGAAIGGPFRLVDEDGRPRTDRDYAGKWRIMYFGYTFCPDVCPVDAGGIGGGLKRFERDEPALGAKVVPLFVTVDPERDSPAVLKAFTANFHPRMVGLTGEPQAIAAAAKAHAVYFQKGKAAPGGGYLMDHQRTAYLLDPDGKPVAILPADQGADAVAAELKRWVTA